ncbi:MAG: hypothetical protein KF891_14490 [Rhizobacter sp.]|nr:hypothetical protein [Rhizobacter sp.]
MKKTTRHSKLGALLLPMAAAAALMAAPAAWAAEGLPAPSNALKTVTPSEAVPLPEVQTSGEVQYVSGGVPYEQLPAFRQARNDFPLNIEIYEREGNKNVFTADADVRVIEAKTGEVLLDTKTEGPYLWAKVPPGQYKVEATLNGTTKESRVAVKGSHPSRAVMVFPSSEDAR